MQYYTDNEAADYLGVKLEYLRRQMNAGKGPAYVRPSPRLTLYTKADLDSYRSSWVKSPARQAVPTKCVT
jgi:Helix-turn-helix domain